MNLEELETKKDELHLDLRELMLEQSEINLKWKRDKKPSSETHRAELAHAINECKTELAELELEIRVARSKGQKTVLEALIAVCKREGHPEYVEEAQAMNAQSEL